MFQKDSKSNKGTAVDIQYYYCSTIYSTAVAVQLHVQLY